MKEKRVLTVTLNPAIDYSVEVPGFRADHVNRASGGRRDPGGKGINVATITSQYGVETAVTGFLGVDNSSIFKEHFEKCGFADEFVYIDGKTREGIKITDPNDSITTDINFPGFELKQSDIDAFFNNYRNLCKGCDYVVLSGSLPASLEAGFYVELAGIAKEEGAFTAVDTYGEALKLVVESGNADLIKPNEHELADAFGNSDASALLPKTGMIALSLGEEGSRLYTRKGIWQAAAPKVDVATTVGAGDSFLGGLISGLSFGKTPDDALRFAAATAASKLTKFGPGWSEQQAPGTFYEKIEVKHIS